MIRYYFRTTVPGLGSYQVVHLKKEELYTDSSMKRGENKIIQKVCPRSTEWCDPTPAAMWTGNFSPTSLGREGTPQPSQDTSTHMAGWSHLSLKHIGFIFQPTVS